MEYLRTEPYFAIRELKLKEFHLSLVFIDYSI